MNPLYLVCDLSDQILKHLLWDSLVMLTENWTEVDSDMGDFRVQADKSYLHLLIRPLTPLLLALTEVSHSLWGFSFYFLASFFFLMKREVLRHSVLGESLCLKSTHGLSSSSNQMPFPLLFIPDKLRALSICPFVRTVAQHCKGRF